MSSFKERIASVRRNPSMIQYLIYDELDKALNTGENVYDLPDATLPFAFAMECGVVETAMAIDEMESISRTLFPKLAMDHQNLYKHMSDHDYIGRFASPSKTTFELLLSHDDILAKSIPFGNLGNKRLTIPRFSEFKAGELKFTMQYPINIEVFPYGGINIIYDNSVLSPIETLTTNILDWDIVNIEGRKLVRIKIPVYQMELTTITDALSPSKVYKNSIILKDHFFYARAYISEGNEWREVYTTHSDLVYDPKHLTVVFKVEGNVLHVSIPAIYTNLRMATGNVRIDVYTTAGEIERELENYRLEQFDLNLVDLDVDRTYVSPLRSFSTIQTLSSQRISGGSNGISLDKLRDRVIHNTLGPTDIPITNVQLDDALDRRGYKLVSNVDNITNRQFLATRKLGKPSELDLVSGAGVSMSQWILDIESISNSKHVYDNELSITIKPELLFKFNDGIVTPLADSEIIRINSMNPDNLVREMSSNRYMYCPFYTVINTAGGGLDVRPYHLDDPVITEKTFVGNNPSSGLQVAIKDYEIQKLDFGYRILVSLEMSEMLFKLDPEKVVVQLGYQPPGENRWASVNSTFIDRIERDTIYQIDIETNHDLNMKGLLRTTNLSMFSNSQVNFRTTLEVNFELTTILTDFRSADYKSNFLDDLIQTHLLPDRFMIIGRESLKTTLGYDLSKLWRRSRVILGPESYAVWEEDVVNRYEENIYERDVDGNIKLRLGSNGEVEYNLLHHKGDPVLDIEGKPTLKHHKGDPKISNGKPILVNPRKLKYEMSTLMLDGIFALGTENAVINYKRELPLTFVNWLSNDIDYLHDRLLEMSNLYLYPTNTFGDVKVKIHENQTITIPIEQSLTVKIYLSEKDFNNPTLRPMLENTCKNVINDHFDKSVVAISDIISKIVNMAGEHIMALDIMGLGGNENNLDILTIEDEAVRLTVKKKLTVLSNQEITVEDDINVVFLLHR